jgi:hypothetical protein
VRQFEMITKPAHPDHWNRFDLRVRRILIALLMMIGFFYFAERVAIEVSNPPPREHCQRGSGICLESVEIGAHCSNFPRVIYAIPI